MRQQRNLDGWFPAISKLEVPSVSGTATHKWCRVAARDISLVIEELVKRAQAQLEAGRHCSLLLPARSKVWGDLSVRNLPKLRVLFGSSVRGFRADGDVSTRLLAVALVRTVR